MPEPNFCLFYKGGRLAFGLIKDFKKNKWVVQPEQGKELFLNKGQTALTFYGGSTANEAEGLALLGRKVSWVQDQAQTLDLETFHELLDKGQPYTLDELAELLLEEPENGWLQAALFLALKDEPYLFHQKKSDFFARSVEEIELLQAKEAREAEAAALAELEQSWADELKAGRKPEVPAAQQEMFDKFVERLHRFLFYLEDNPEAAHFAQLFGLNLKGGLHAERPIIEALRLCGEEISWGRLQVEREGVQPGFSEAEEAQARAIAGVDPFENAFGLTTEDLRSLGGFSVDNHSTEDYDDAFSLAADGDDLILWVHIAEVASHLERDTPLFEGAWHRAASFYSPCKTFPMFPPRLSADYFSLVAGQDRGTLSFKFRFDRQGNLVARELCRAVVRLKDNWTYERCDQAIESGEGLWARLWQVCEGIKQARLEAGALELDRAEIRFDLSDPEHPVLLEESRETPAHQLVQELAILVNAQAAQFAKQGGQVNLFRNQEPYQVTRELAEGERPKLQDLIIRPAQVGLEPQGHAALGLDAYMQCTSPIRRFLDLISQRLLLEQMASAQPSFEPKQLAQWADEADGKVKRLGQLERRLWEHWKYRYLATQVGQTFEVEWFKELRGGRTLVRLKALDLKLPIHGELEPGQSHRACIRFVDAAYEEVDLELIELEAVDSGPAEEPPETD